METTKSIGTPMSPLYKLDKDKYGKNADIKLHTNMIGSLFYVTVSRSDIIFSICIYARS